MLNHLWSGKTILNIDESFISETNYSRRMWCPSQSPATLSGKLVSPRLALLTALDTDGWVYFAVSHSNTDSRIMLIFLSQLA